VGRETPLPGIDRKPVCATLSQDTVLNTFIVTIIYIKGDRGSTVFTVCATNRKVAGSIPAGVIGILH